MGERHGVHGARARARDAIDVECGLLQRPIEHPQVKAPCEPPPCSATPILRDSVGAGFLPSVDIGNLTEHKLMGLTPAKLNELMRRWRAFQIDH